MVDWPEPSRLARMPCWSSREASASAGQTFEITAGDYGEAPPTEERLILGHEISLGEVLEAPPGSGFEPGQLVVGVVRRPDPEPCDHCAQDEWDMCRNDPYVESGIKQRHGYAQELLCTLEPELAVPVDAELGDLGVLVEPASVVAKAGTLALHILQRSAVPPRTTLITGAGPIRPARRSRHHPAPAWTPTSSTSSRADPSRTSCVTWARRSHAGPIDELTIAADMVIECTGVGSVGGCGKQAATPHPAQSSR